MNKNQNLPNKNYQSNNSSGKPLPGSYNNYRSQSPYQNIFRRRSLDRRNFQSYSQNRYRDQTVRIINIEIITQDQTQLEVIFWTIIVIVRIHTLGTETIPKTVQEIHHTIESYSNNGNQNYSNNRSRIYSNNSPYYNNNNNRSRVNSGNRNNTYSKKTEKLFSVTTYKQGLIFKFIQSKLQK